MLEKKVWSSGRWKIGEKAFPETPSSSRIDQMRVTWAPLLQGDVESNCAGHVAMPQRNRNSVFEEQTGMDIKGANIRVHHVV